MSATRVAIMGIIVEDTDSVEELNELLHEYRAYIIGRMGVPYRQRSVSVISVALDAPQDVTSALAGKVGSLTGVSVKTLYSNVVAEQDAADA
ncbi:TM1266 family iron-only hydrogenase system putative regulator [Collinsella tanakaei]|uniref:TM1266 family iron-only hydrogenase system putative regulator n=1 Tax=Collinsella tanakaei TaxID=626935 RepID=UPI001F2B3FF2|nr:TM1266 family iron-only hydrogenase system putative regulator [Collinsella tanakaei]MCF2621067.1 iron-only hydrogenase system regulator [Collinsella tanakaei]MDM8302120.1 iron-only hydrogenase system regulator [Collinsella tanakaei]